MQPVGFRCRPATENSACSGTHFVRNQVENDTNSSGPGEFAAGHLQSDLHPHVAAACGPFTATKVDSLVFNQRWRVRRRPGTERMLAMKPCPGLSTVQVDQQSRFDLQLEHQSAFPHQPVVADWNSSRRSTECRFAPVTMLIAETFRRHQCIFVAVAGDALNAELRCRPTAPIGSKKLLPGGQVGSGSLRQSDTDNGRVINKTGARPRCFRVHPTEPAGHCHHRATSFRQVFSSGSPFRACKTSASLPTTLTPAVWRPNSFKASRRR
ncbi:MAG: hypothetical protein JNM56_34205 [Planctomycetia bacterium]|nr:hypothetical protein [Planctomycetia bacterium]